MTDHIKCFREGKHYDVLVVACLGNQSRPDTNSTGSSGKRLQSSYQQFNLIVRGATKEKMKCSSFNNLFQEATLIISDKNPKNIETLQLLNKCQKGKGAEVQRSRQSTAEAAASTNRGNHQNVQTSCQHQRQHQQAQAEQQQHSHWESKDCIFITANKKSCSNFIVMQFACN